jgi:hypothetical protein
MTKINTSYYEQRRSTCLVNLAAQIWHSSVRGMEGRLPRCRRFREMVPFLLSSMLGGKFSKAVMSGDMEGGSSGQRRQVTAKICEDVIRVSLPLLINKPDRLTWRLYAQTKHLRRPAINSY